mgnify:CR=1 FL=1
MNSAHQGLKGYQYSMKCVLQVSGEDAQSFLQSQFSNDLSDAQPFSSIYGLWLNVKGRVLADSHIILQSKNCYLILSEFTEGSFIKDMLKKHIIADDVEVEAIESYGAISLNQPEPEDALRYLGIGAIIDNGNIHSDDSIGVIFRSQRFEGNSTDYCFLDKEVSEEFALFIVSNSDPSKGGINLIGENEMHLNRIELGSPLVPKEIGPGDLAAEGGFVPSCVSLTKGCYLGQEVVARLHHLGKCQRQLYAISLEPIEGSSDSLELPLSIEYEGRAIGQLRSVYNAEGLSPNKVGVALVKVRYLDVFKESIQLRGYGLNLIKALG